MEVNNHNPFCRHPISQIYGREKPTSALFITILCFVSPSDWITGGWGHILQRQAEGKWDRGEEINSCRSWSCAGWVIHLSLNWEPALLVLWTEMTGLWTEMRLLLVSTASSTTPFKYFIGFSLSRWYKKHGLIHCFLHFPLIQTRYCLSA